MAEADGRARGGRPKKGEPVVDRALSLLAAFSDRHRALTLSELARMTEMPPATALRLLARLTAWGAVERLDDGRYVVGVRLWEVASLSPRGHGVREIALPYLEDLFEVTRQHVMLAVRDNTEAVLIERLSAKQATAAAYRVGGRLPLRTTAVGLILLAFSSRRFQEEVIQSPQPEEPGVEALTEAELRKALADVKRTEFSTVRRVKPSQTVSVAAPIRNGGREVIAAVSVLIPAHAAAPSAVGPAVSAAARAISRNLGYRSPGPTAALGSRNP
jgi:DNA-binding IclR family transcriptional regulator